MATSVSKISVQIGANTTQLTAGMQQAAGAVAGGMKNIQGVAQQAAFAIDDFLAAFQTGGVAGGLRGAGNNLSMIAMTLGGIKAQLIAVGVITSAGLIASAFSKSAGAASKLADEVDKVANAANRMRELRLEGVADMFDTSRSGNAQNFPGANRMLNDVRHRMMVSGEVLARLQEDLAATANQFIPGEMEGATEVANHFKKIRDEELADIDKRISKETETLEVLRGQELVLSEIVRRKREAIAPGVPGDRFGFFSGAPAAQGIKGELKLDALRKGVDPFQFFGKLPGANQFGSIGAVSSINQAMAGPGNVENSQLRELQKISRSSADAARALGGKLPIAVEVAL